MYFVLIINFKYYSLPLFQLFSQIDQIATTLNPKLLNLNDLSTAMYNVRISADTGSEGNQSQHISVCMLRRYVAQWHVTP